MPEAPLSRVLERRIPHEPAQPVLIAGPTGRVNPRWRWRLPQEQGGVIVNTRDAPVRFTKLPAVSSLPPACRRRRHWHGIYVRAMCRPGTAIPVVTAA